MPVAKFIDNSTKKDQGITPIHFPEFYKKFLDFLCRRLNEKESLREVYLGSVSLNLHVRIKYHDNKQSTYLFGWKKAPKGNANEHLEMIKKGLYINRHNLKKLGLITDNRHNTLKSLLQNAGYRVNGSKEERENTFLDTNHNNGLNIQAGIMRFLCAIE